MKPIKLTESQMDAALGLEATEMDHEKTGNRKCWHVIDTRDMVIEETRLTHAQAAQLSLRLPHRNYCREGFKLVQCDGEAHDNPHIDNCMQCAPRWGWVMVPADACTCDPDRPADMMHERDCPRRALTHVEKTLLGALK